MLQSQIRKCIMISLLKFIRKICPYPWKKNPTYWFQEIISQFQSNMLEKNDLLQWPLKERAKQEEKFQSNLLQIMLESLQVSPFFLKMYPRSIWPNTGFWDTELVSFLSSLIIGHSCLGYNRCMQHIQATGNWWTRCTTLQFSSR